MDPFFLFTAIGITVAWIGLFIFYMRTVRRQRELQKELSELELDFKQIQEAINRD